MAVLLISLFTWKDMHWTHSMERYIVGTSLSTNVTLGICIPSVSYIVKCFWDGMSILSNTHCRFVRPFSEAQKIRIKFADPISYCRKYIQKFYGC